MVYLIARGHRHGRKVPLRSYSQPVRSVAGKVPFSRCKMPVPLLSRSRFQENTRLACPTCGKSCSVHDHRHRKWRHLDTCQFTTIVEADVPRIMCPEHGCLTLPVPVGWPRSRYTLLFESFVLSWLKISTVDAVRKQLKLSWNAVDEIMTRAVKRGLARIKKRLSARHMNVDEVAFKKGHRYITVISDSAMVGRWP